MAKVNVVGNAMVITSTAKFDDLVKAEKYRPGALTVYATSEDGNRKEPVFSVATGTNESISKFGICFKNKSRDGGFAQMTLAVVGPDDEAKPDDVKKMIADKYGSVLTYLNVVEQQVPEVLTGINKDIEEVLNMIEVK